VETARQTRILDMLGFKGKLTTSGVTADQIFFILVPFNTNTNVVPVSATACVGGIDGFLGCVIMPHNSCDPLMFKVITVLSSSSSIVFLVGYKLGWEPNYFTHIISTCSAPQCQLGNWLLCITFVHASYPAEMYWFAFVCLNPS
jgi:hypothetical protein